MFFKSEPGSWGKKLDLVLRGVTMIGLALAVTGFAPVAGFRMTGLALLVDCALHLRNPEVPTDRYNPDMTMCGWPARAFWCALLVIGLGLTLGAGGLSRFFFSAD